MYLCFLEMRWLLFFLFAASSYNSKAQNLDTTRHGFGKAKFGLFFKRHFDLHGMGAKSRYRKEGISTTRLAFPFDSRGYRLVFSDDFDSFNHNVWGVGQPWGSFHGDFPHQYYGDSEVFVQNGILHLLNRYAPKKFNHEDSIITIPYGTGLVNTWKSASFVYGYFAIRSKNPQGPATWPAFWLTGKNNWPPEIDIFEMYGTKKGGSIHKQTMTLHFGKTETRTKLMWVKKLQLPKNTDTQFHIYSCLWEKGKISFFTDGALTKKFYLNRWMEQFYRENMYVIINNAVDHRFLEFIDNSALPADFQVDWIRIYQKKE